MLLIECDCLDVDMVNGCVECNIFLCMYVLSLQMKLMCP